MRTKPSRPWGSTADEATRMEDYARILDFLPQGHPDQSKYHREPLAYALGVDEFKLFELVPKEGVTLSVGQRVYIGKDIDMRTEVLHVKRRVGYEELTTAAQKELPFVIAETVKEKEEKFVDFFNRAQAITTRFHMLELLPGLGKKTMWGSWRSEKKGPSNRSRSSISASRASIIPRSSARNGARWRSRTRPRNTGCSSHARRRSPPGEESREPVHPDVPRVIITGQRTFGPSLAIRKT